MLERITEEKTYVDAYTQSERVVKTTNIHFDPCTKKRCDITKYALVIGDMQLPILDIAQMQRVRKLIDEVLAGEQEC